MISERPAVTFQLTPQPWVFTSQPSAGFRIVAFRPAPEVAPLILPSLYGRQTFPIADRNLHGVHRPRTLKLSEYSGAVLLRNNVVVSSSTSELLPPTFLRKRTLHHGGLRYLAERDAYNTRYPVDLGRLIAADRPIYYADTDKPSVYGHVLLEAFTRFWALAEAEKDIAIATSVKIDRNYARLLAGVGVAADRVVHIDRPVLAKMVLFPTMAISRRNWVHPAAWEVFDRLKHLAKDSDVGIAERIFVSRSRVPGRELLNQLEVEAYFQSKSFAIVHPQELKIEDQIKLFSSARMIAGAGGSAIHNALFAPPDAKILIVCSEGWLINADILLSQVPGRLGYVFGKPIKSPEGTHRTQSPWVVDMDEVKNAANRHFGLPRAN